MLKTCQSKLVSPGSFKNACLPILEGQSCQVTIIDSFTIKATISEVFLIFKPLSVHSGFPSCPQEMEKLKQQYKNDNT